MKGCPFLRLAGDRKGATIVEFAMVVPVMLLLLLGGLELGHLYFARMVLDGAVVEAARIASASMETSEAQRTLIMQDSITKRMAAFRLTPGKSLVIVTKVYNDFSSSYPEPFTDQNLNGRYDPPNGSFAGEPFSDRNNNGSWDPATPKTGTLGGPGDVVSYTARFPAALLFDIQMRPIGISGGLDLLSTAVTRNEAVVRRAA